MSKKIDMAGWKMWEHGVPDSKLIVIEEAPRPATNHGKHTFWKCRCLICNNTAVIDGANIRSGKTKTCGCQTNKKKDLTGRIFGKLIVLNENLEHHYTSNTRKRIFWDCKCQCGKTTIVTTSDLTSGHTTSCGCQTYKTKNENFEKQTINKKFNFLTALEPTNERNPYDAAKIWKFKCDCGNIVYYPINRVKSGHNISCGCKNRSLGELKIKEILELNNIPYIHDKGYFSDLVSENNRVLRYDFILLKDNTPYRIIEFDGELHYSIKEHFGGIQEFNSRKNNDKKKNEYARAHNIPLVRIPYKERDHITLEMLFGDQYLIV